MRVHLVDGTYELFRAHFGAPAAMSPSGMEVGATRGLMRSLYALLRTPGVTHVAVAFDTVVESFRNEMFEGYKRGDSVEPALFAQFPLAERATRALGVVCWGMVEFEADDALATGALRYGVSEEVEQVVVCSPDKDLCQIVTGQRIVTLDRVRDNLRDEAGVVEKFGIGPAAIPDYLALVGDTADGIPGIRGWGAKSTATVLAHYGSLEDIPDDAGAWEVKVRGAARLAANLAAGREAAALYKELATLRTDVPLAEELDDLRWRGAIRSDLEALCQELGENDLPSRIQQWIGTS